MTTTKTDWTFYILFLFLNSADVSYTSSEHVFRDCQRVYKQESSEYTEPGSTVVRNFSSPHYPSEYPKNLECIYQFIANPGYRVQLMFDDFALGGNAPKCDHYIDMYTEVNGTFNFPDEQLSGRFCGSVSPGPRISLYNIAVIVFHARGEKGEKGFHGKFQFVDEKYHLNAVGRCGSTIRHKKHGTILSPTYPGKYPANLFCTYKLFGQPGQRIKLFFKDFDLYFGGPHCPYDSLTIYDGDSNHAVIIQKLCGLQQTLEIFSETENLLLEFKTVDAPYAEHRGFEIEYTFSRTFVDLRKMVGNDRRIKPIRGTECDMHLVSNGESEHLIRSPNYPDAYPRNTTCTYILDGMQGAQKLEQVSLEFQSFSIQSNSPDGDNTIISNCQGSLVAIYNSGQDFKEANAALDYVLCGRLPDGFKLKPILTDFGIPGTKKVDKNNIELCHFEMEYDLSTDTKDKTKNFFNSPRYPDDYLANSTCRYDINAPRGKVILIYFEQFSLHPGWADHDKGGDHVDMYSIFENGTRVLYATYNSIWKDTIPGLTISLSNRVTVEFISDASGINTGFKAYYMFLPSTKNSDCDEVIENSNGGTFVSPGFGTTAAPGTGYTAGMNCHWTIKVRPGYRILMEPVTMKIEGKMSDDGHDSACRNAVVRVFNSSSTVGREFCGDVLKNPGVRQFVSHDNIMHISFITSPEKSLSFQGFNFSWTEFRDDPSCTHPDLFQCVHNKYCISKDLKCNEAPNCGDMDQSDEDKMSCNVRSVPSRQTLQQREQQATAKQKEKDLQHQQKLQQQRESEIWLHQREVRRKPTSPLPTMAVTSPSKVAATSKASSTVYSQGRRHTVDDTFGKTAILTGCGIGLVLLIVLIIGCIVARRSWKRKTSKALNDKYPSIQRRPLNSSSLTRSTRHAHDGDLC